MISPYALWFKQKLRFSAMDWRSLSATGEVYHLIKELKYSIQLSAAESIIRAFATIEDWLLCL
jgi:hypothetical protein